MKRRPWPIVILALMQIVIEPLSNLFLNSYWSHVSPKYYLMWFVGQHDWVSLFYVFGLPPIMGLSVYAMKRWSYAVFFVGATWMLIQNFQEVHSGQMFWPMALSLYIGNLAFVGYFMLPAVKEPFWNPRLRWWETKPRFLVDYTGRFETDSGNSSCRILNVSEGGAFVSCSEKFQVGDTLHLRFSSERNDLVFSKVRIVFSRPGYPGDAGYGVQFIELAPLTRQTLARVIRELHRTGTPVQNRAPGSGWEDFRQWLARVVRTGQGLVPEWQRNAAASAAKPAIADAATETSMNNETQETEQKKAS